MIPIYTKHARYLPPQRQEADEGLPGALGKRRLLKSPLDVKETQPVHPKGNQLWIFIRRTDAEAEAPIPWLPNAKSQLIVKDPDAGKDWGEEEKGVTEDEMVEWHHQLIEHEFEETQGDSEGQGSLAYFSPWGRKECDMAEWLNSNKGFGQGGNGE